jgi:hypothetical protein
VLRDGLVLFYDRIRREAARWLKKVVVKVDNPPTAEPAIAAKAVSMLDCSVESIVVGGEGQRRGAISCWMKLSDTQAPAASEGAIQ